MNFNRPIDYLVINELREHLETAQSWANEGDGSLDAHGFSCVKSIMEAINMGRPGLALERWNDLSSPNKPELSAEAEAWEMLEAIGNDYGVSKHRKKDTTDV